MKKLIIGIFLILIGFFCFYGFVKIRKNDLKKLDYLNSANYLPSQKVLEENEGKLVILSGKFELQDQAKDEEFRLSLPSPLIVRFVEYYKKTDNGYRWEVQYETNETYKYKKEIFYGSVTLGEFTITNDTLLSLSSNTPYNGFTKGDANDLGLKIEEHKNGETYLTEAYNIKNEDNNSDYEDAMRIYYQYYDPDKVGTKTIIGIQKGNNIVSTDDFTLKVYDGIKNQTDIVKDLYKPNTSGNLFTIGSFILFEIFGIILIINRNKDSI